MERVVLTVTGMSCQSCVQSVELAVSKVDGVIVARARLDPGELRIRFDEGRTSSLALADVVRAAGFGVPQGEQ
jgi:copper chaperone CopZ